MNEKRTKISSKLRGHGCGVTGLAYCKHHDVAYLISGDEDGTVIIWDLNLSRCIRHYPKLVSSRIQSLKVIRLVIENARCNILVIQSRNNGLHLLDLTSSLDDDRKPPNILATFPTYDSLFSRGDAISIEGEEELAILVYPSCIESNLVTVRVLGPNAATKYSGTACRELAKKCSVFDISVKANPCGGYLLFIAYEDGCLCAFSFAVEATKSFLDTKGMKIDLLKTYDVKINDFISAFDITFNRAGQISLICGSPSRNLVIIDDSIKFNCPHPTVTSIPLKRQGISGIAVRQDRKIFVSACWDNSIKLYSLKTKKHLASLDHHSSQVQSILFIEKPQILEVSHSEVRAKAEEIGYLLCCASMDCTISVTSIY